MATVAQIEALNEQFSALREAGVLQHPRISQNPAEVVDINEVIRRQVRRGDSVEQVLSAPIGKLPDPFCQTALAGIRSGQLSAGFEQTWVPIDRTAQLRRYLGCALTYPLIVVVMAFLFMLFLCLVTIPRLEESSRVMMLEPSSALRWGIAMRATLPIWAPVGATAMFVGWLWHVRSGRSGSLLGELRLFRLIPGVRRVARDLQLAQVAELTSRLVDQSVPADEAYEVAMAATVNGSTMDVGPTQPPPFLAWALQYPASDTERAESLRIASQLYDDRAQFYGQRMQTLIPLVAVVFFAGSMVTLYAITFWQPFCSLLTGIAEQNTSWMGM